VDTSDASTSRGEAEDRDETTDKSTRDKLNEDDDNLTALREQLSTLSLSLATVTTQKSKMEASYMADKRKIKVNSFE